MKHTSFAVFLLLAVTVGGSAQIPDRPVTWSLATPSAGAPARLTATIASGWKLYSLTQPAGGPMATRISVLGARPLRLGGRIERPSPDTIPDAIFGIMSEVYEDSVSFRIPLAGRSGRRQQLQIAVTFQACTTRVCLTPRTDTLSATIRSGR